MESLIQLKRRVSRLRSEGIGNRDDGNIKEYSTEGSQNHIENRTNQSSSDDNNSDNANYDYPKGLLEVSNNVMEQHGQYAIADQKHCGPAIKRIKVIGSDGTVNYEDLDMGILPAKLAAKMDFSALSNNNSAIMPAMPTFRVPQNPYARYEPAISDGDGENEPEHGKPSFIVRVKTLPKEREALHRHLIQSKLLVAEHRRRHRLQVTPSSRVFPYESRQSGSDEEDDDEPDHDYGSWQISDHEQNSNAASNPALPNRLLRSTHMNSDMSPNSHGSRFVQSAASRPRRMISLNACSAITDEEVRSAYDKLQLSYPQCSYDEMNDSERNVYRFVRRRLMNKNSARQSRLRRKQLFKDYEATMRAQEERLQQMQDQLRLIVRCLLNAVTMMSLQSIPLMTGEFGRCSNQAGCGASPSCSHCDRFKVFNGAVIKAVRDTRIGGVFKNYIPFTAVNLLEHEFYSDPHGIAQLLVNLGFCSQDDPLHQLFQRQERTLNSIMQESGITDFLCSGGVKKHVPLPSWKLDLVTANAVRSAWFLFFGPDEQSVLFQDREQILKLIDSYGLESASRGDKPQMAEPPPLESVVSDLFCDHHGSRDPDQPKLLAPFVLEGQIPGKGLSSHCMSNDKSDDLTAPRCKYAKFSKSKSKRNDSIM